MYRLSDLDPSLDFLRLFCTGTPIAAGTGSARLLDNDVFGTGGRTNAVTFQIRGTVTDLSSGQLLRILAGFHIVQDLAGFPEVPPTVKLLRTFVQLRPVGGT